MAKRRILLLVLALAAGVAALFVSLNRPVPAAVWLGKSEEAFQAQRSKIIDWADQLKWKVEQWFSSTFSTVKYQVMDRFSSELYLVRNDIFGEIMPKTTAFTNSEGARAWVLSPDGMVALGIRMRMQDSRNKPQERSRMAIWLTDGGHGGVYDDETFKGAALGSQAGVPASGVGLRIDFQPRRHGESVSLMVGAKLTQAVTNAAALQRVTLTTNFDLALRAVLQKGGGLMVCPQFTNELRETGYLLLIVPDLLPRNGQTPKSIQTPTKP